MARQKNPGPGASEESTAKAGIDRAKAPTRAAVIVPVLPRSFRADDETAQNRPRLTRSADARHEEAVGLARAIALDIVYSAVVVVNDPRPATLLGSGKVEEIAAIVEEEKIEVVIFDHPLTPVQQRNLEKGLDAKRTDSGLHYVITKAGKGASPKPGQVVTVHYTGTTLDGKKFDSSLDRGQPFEFPLGQGRVIQGWDEGIALLNKGAKATLIIPSPMAYGERSPSPAIPANSILRFEVELIDAQ